MSTYLIAWYIGYFDYIEGFTKSNIRIRFYFPIGRKADSFHTIKVTIKGLEFFEKYFDISYPLNKLDIISVHQVTDLAMENWGCILCKHSIVLYDPYKIDLEELQSNVTTLCHEIAHMWFGNLVTMEWWNDLWLNEGFAELFSFISIDSIFP